MDKQSIRMKCLEMAMKFAEQRHVNQQGIMGQYMPTVTYNEVRLLEVAQKLESYICEPEPSAKPRRNPAARKR